MKKQKKEVVRGDYIIRTWNYIAKELVHWHNGDEWNLFDQIIISSGLLIKGKRICYSKLKFSKLRF